MEQFNIPVVLFTFKRSDTVLRIIDVLRVVKPTRVYIFSDGPRNSLEESSISLTRKIITDSIDWECEVFKFFETENKGVFNQIGLGALKVFEKEDKAIFIEDDNLPEVTFFKYCEEMLDRYEKNPSILWVCGTNYETESSYLESSYVYTQQMLPCGWASWRIKFSRYYLTSFSVLDYKPHRKMIKKNYQSKALYRQQIRNYRAEHYRENHGLRFASWDFHMACTIRLNNFYGIAPKYNQIRNIGVDIYSTHGGTTMNKANTSNFCEVPTKQLDFPLIAPTHFGINEEFEKKTTAKILAPRHIRYLFPIITITKKLLKLYPDNSFTSIFKRR